MAAATKRKAVPVKALPKRKVGRPKLEAPSDVYVQQRSSILQKATQLLNEGVLTNLSLGRIAAALGVSKASMYYYFSSKHHLLYALYEDYLDRQFERMSQILEVADARVRLIEMLHCQINGILKNLQIVRLRLSHFPFIDDPIVERCLRKELRHTTTLTKVVEGAIAAGHLPAINSHKRTFETFTVMQGRFEFRWGEEGQHSVVLERFDTFSVPPNVHRAFRNIGDGEGILQVIISGGVHDSRDIVFPRRTADEIRARDPRYLDYFREKANLEFEA